MRSERAQQEPGQVGLSKLPLEVWILKCKGKLLKARERCIQISQKSILVCSMENVLEEAMSGSFPIWKLCRSSNLRLN